MRPRFPFAGDREAHAGEAEAQRQRGHRIGHDRAQRDARAARSAPRAVPHWATPSISSETPTRATIVSPAMVRWPSRTWLEVPAGR